MGGGAQLLIPYNFSRKSIKDVAPSAYSRLKIHVSLNSRSMPSIIVFPDFIKHLSITTVREDICAPILPWMTKIGEPSSRLFANSCRDESG